MSNIDFSTFSKIHSSMEELRKKIAPLRAGTSLDLWDDGYCVAGGFLRDVILGREPKDLDVVVEDSAEWDLEWEEFSEGDFEYDEGQVTHLYNSSISVQGCPVQFMCRSVNAHPSSLVKYHALALSNFFWWENRLTIDESAIRDVTDRKHTKNQGRWTEKGFEAYYNKIYKKYPWPLRGRGNEHEDLI